MTPSTVIVLLAFSLIASDILPSEARYKSYQRRRSSRYLRQQRRQIDETDLNELLIAAVSQTISTILTESPITCTPARRRNSNSNFNYNSNINSLVDSIGQRQADLEGEDDAEGGDAEEGDEEAPEDSELSYKRAAKRRQLKARRRNRNNNVNVNQNYNLSARKEETNPSAEGSNEEESTTETPKIESRHRRRKSLK